MDMGALREAISAQNVGAPADVEESHREFREADELGISAAVFNSAINTKALIKAAQEKWVNQGTPITAADVQEIDAPIKEVQRAAAMTDYNIRTNRDPNQTVSDLSKAGMPRLFGIDPDTRISDLTDEQLEDLVKQGVGGQGISDSLFWSARNEQSNRGTTVSENQFTGALESTPLSEDEKSGFVDGADLSSTVENFNLNKIPGQEGISNVTSFDINAPKGDTPYTTFLRQLLGADTSGWAADAESFNIMADMARNYILTNPDYGADANTRGAAAADPENVIEVVRNALGDIRTISGFEDLPIGQYMNAHPDMFGKLQPSGSDLTGYDLNPMVTTQAAMIPNPSDGLGFLEGVMSPENLSELGVNAESYASQVPFQTAWKQQAAATPGSMNPLVSRALSAQSPFAKLQYELSGSGGSPRSFLQDYNPWSAGEFETGLASVMESAAGLDLTKGSFTAEDIEAAKWAQWLAQPENMLSAIQTPTLMRTDPFKRDTMKSAFQRLYDIAASRDPAGGANVDIASLFGGLR